MRIVIAEWRNDDGGYIVCGFVTISIDILTVVAVAKCAHVLLCDSTRLACFFFQPDQPRFIFGSQDGVVAERGADAAVRGGGERTRLPHSFRKQWEPRKTKEVAFVCRQVRPVVGVCVSIHKICFFFLRFYFVLVFGIIQFGKHMPRMPFECGFVLSSLCSL